MEPSTNEPHDTTTAPSAMTGEHLYTCPLCSLEFIGSTCHSSCPMSTGCAMVRCPGCHYEFIEDGWLAGKLRKWFGKK